MSTSIGHLVEDLSFVKPDGTSLTLSDFGDTPVVLIFQRQID